MNPHKAIVHENEVDWMELAHGERIAFRRKLLGQATGAEKLGCSLFEVAPGKRAWPFHYHFANEEALYILEGSGTLRLGAEEFQIGPGHFVTFRAAGDRASAYQHRVGTAALSLFFDDGRSGSRWLSRLGKVGDYRGSGAGWVGTGERDAQVLPGGIRGGLLRGRGLRISRGSFQKV